MKENVQRTVHKKKGNGNEWCTILGKGDISKEIKKKQKNKKQKQIYYLLRCTVANCVLLSGRMHIEKYPHCYEERGPRGTGGSRGERKHSITSGDARTFAHPTCGASARLVDLYRSYVCDFVLFCLAAVVCLLFLGFLF